jgi:ribosome recycling factor
VISDVLADATVKMDKAVGVAKEDFSTVRTGRANPGLFQKVLVSYYGTPTPLSQLASLQNIEARTLLVTPYDKGALRDIEQAIRDMPNLGANPTNDGSVIRINLPELTAERRKEFVKIVRTKAEDAKIAVRNIRRSAKSDLDALKGDPRGEGARGPDQAARGRHRRGAQAQGIRTARGVVPCP